MRKSIENEALQGVQTYADLMPAFLAAVEFRLKILRGNLTRVPYVSEGEQSALVAHMLRNLHTLRAIVATYGFHSMSDLAWEAEGALDLFRRPDSAAKWDTKAWAQINPHLDKLEISFAEIHGLVDKLIPKVATADSKDTRNDPRNKPLANAFLPLSKLSEKFSETILHLGTQLGKLLEFRALPSDLEIAPALFSAWEEPVIHLLRNAADHGIEMEALRLLKGKPSTGLVQLIIEPDKSGCRITVGDDGQGIHTNLVVQKAMDLGLVTGAEVEGMPENEKQNLIFRLGFTMGKSSVGISGLGVGLDVVAEWSKANGGYATVVSQVGTGTRITLHLGPRFGTDEPGNFRS